MKNKTRYLTTFTMIILMLSFAFASLAAAAGSITLNPTTQAVNSQVIVTGTGFGATKAVGIGLGQEIVVVNEVHNIPTPTGTGPFTAYMSHVPIKPGSFSFHCVVSSDSSVVESDYTDNGDGTLTSSSTYALNPFVNYVTGAFGRSTTSAWDGYTVVFTCNYTYYQLGVTPTAGVTSSGSGGFTTNITIPSTSYNGTNTVTAIDTSGNKGTATLTVTGGVIIPETLTFGMVALLSSVAVIAAYFWKRPKTATSRYTKL
jgi:hypothetical protein